MESVGELVHESDVEVLKASVGNDEESVPASEVSLCHTSNGDADTSVNSLQPADAVYYVSTGETPVPPEPQSVSEATSTTEVIIDANFTDTSIMSETADSQPEEEMLVMETTAAVEHLGDVKSSEVMTSVAQVLETTEIPYENELLLEGSGVEGENIDGFNDTVTFKTEILVEKNDNDVMEDSNNVAVDEHDHTNNILNELSQGIELSEALRSSDATENTENNNCAERGEMFNKEELLDILEGNDVSTSGNEDVDMDKKMREAQMAIRQLSRLKNKQGKRGRVRYSLAVPRRSRVARKQENDEKGESANENDKEENNKDILHSKAGDKNTQATPTDENNAQSKKNESIVNSLVKDWDDDDPAESEQNSEVLTVTDSILKTDELINSQEVMVKEETVSTTPAEKSKTQAVDANKSGDETQPRRLSRVIKKKVIFDPDNPDTFTKGKAVSKTKEAHVEKEPPPKKVKSEQLPVRSKSKSPVAKSPWKKPNPKNNSKQNKRLTEVDKLLMDEGAVNMIYQLTPEAPKGKKNMKTKAEFIKKLQSSTPEGKEMKFRERKKELKCEEIEAKRILVGKQRTSLSSSVKSPSVCEDFETHSADDSIIYRRHSSSSYSSSCMSPRRLSDGDNGATQNATRLSQQQVDGVSDTQNQTHNLSGDKNTDIFMPDAGAEIINKDDCLSIKEKLNSKLSQVLNKRKRENNKTEKPAKQKKVSKIQERSDSVKIEKTDVKHITMVIDQRVAEICIRGTVSTVEMFQELDQALQYINDKKDTFVTLLTSESGTLCSKLDLRPLLDDNLEQRTDSAYEIAESIRAVLCSIWRHSKLLVSGVWGPCSGVAPALLALSDVSLADHHATIGLDTLPPVFVTGAITSSSRRLSKSLVNELVLFGRNMSAAEALRGGLVDRILWPGSADHLRAAAKDLTAQPPQSLLLKKKLLNLERSVEADTTFLSKLEKERDLLVEYWTSVEGQDVIRASLDA